MLLCQTLPRCPEETHLRTERTSTVYVSICENERESVCVFGHLFPSACGIEMMKRPLQLVRSG